MEEPQQVDAGDLGHVGEHDDRRDRQTPAADPADPGPERLGAPCERGAAVGGVLAELAIGERDQQHGDEGEHEHGRSLFVHCCDDKTESGGKAVGGCHG